VGETLTLRIIKIDSKRHRIGLSLQKVDSAEYASLDLEMLQEELHKEDGSAEEEEQPDEEPPEPEEN
jgi:transcriptional accessory protein Tex/SPT6